MSNLAQLKQKARSFEQREQWPSALDVYEAMAEEQNDGHDPDVGLWNRIGDLHMRLGRSREAVVAYERAVAAYEAAGLHNNAIALCNKILRITPDRTATYLRLGLISAAKGFFADARQHLGQYVELVSGPDGPDAALETLSGIVEQAPADDAEVRRAVAAQLTAHGRHEDALRLLRAAHAILLDRGPADEATRVWEQVCEIDPRAEPDAPPVMARREVRSDEQVDDLELEIRGDVAEDRQQGESEPESPGSLLEPEPAFELDVIAMEGLDGFEPTAADETRTPDEGAEPICNSGGGPLDDSPDDFRLDLPLPSATPADEGENDRDTDAPRRSLLDEADPALPPITLMTPHDDVALDIVQGESGFEQDLDREVGSDSIGSMDAIFITPGAGDASGSDQDDELETDLGEDWSAAIITPWPSSEVEDQDEHSDEPIDLSADGTLELEAAVDVPVGTPIADHRTEYGFSFDADESGSDPADATELVDAPDALAALLAASPDDLEVAEALAAAGGPLAEEALTRAMNDLLERNDVVTARQIHDLAMSSVPGSLALLRSAVELAQRSGEAAAVLRSCEELAGALQAAGEADEARTAWEQVLEFDADHAAARSALGFPDPAPSVGADDGYIDLAALIMEDEPENGSTRFVVEADAPTGDENHDFSEILARFREQVSRNIAHDDANAHYDLGVAFKEMGLLEEATSEFQLALRAGANPLATMEMLGECFVSREHYAVGRRVIDGAVRSAEASDGEMVGLLYWLGRCEESLGGREAAAECFERVLAVDVRFRDASERLRVLHEEGSAVSF
jgi:tetratricopeptide (TPR) repeat protein